MALFDLFRIKKKAEKVEEPKKELKKVPKIKVEGESVSAGKVKAKEVQAPKPKRKKKFADAYKILKGPHVTEKATDLTDENQYVFKVWTRSNKIEIKKAVESLYNIDVIDVKIIKVPAKKRRIGKIEGHRKGYKKAIVKIKEGQKIEVLPR